MRCLRRKERKLTDGGLILSGLKNIRLVHYEGNVVIRRHLESLPLESFDSVSIYTGDADGPGNTHTFWHGPVPLTGKQVHLHWYLGLSISLLIKVAILSTAYKDKKAILIYKDKKASSYSPTSGDKKSLPVTDANDTGKKRNLQVTEALHI